MEARERSKDSILVTVVILMLSTLVAPTAASSSSNSGSYSQSHTTLFVTLPTPLSDALQTFYPTTTDQDPTITDHTTDYPTTVKEVQVWEGGNEARSALLRLPPTDSKMTFLADDHEAAARIPELLNHGRSGGVAGGAYQGVGAGVGADVGSGAGAATGRGALFPKTRSRTKPPPGPNTGMTDYVDAKVDLEVGSRHHYSSFHRHPPSIRRPPPPFLVSGGPHSVIDKQDPLASYTLRPGGGLRRPFHNITRVLNIKAECQDDFMRIQVQFNGSFTGLVYSSGYAYDGECIYVNGSGDLEYSFLIKLNRCGTLNDNQKIQHNNIRGRQPTKNMMWNTVTVQYNPLIEEVLDEHFKVTCEYGYDFWKTVTFPFLDVEVQTGNPVVFSLTPPECHMEIRYGLGTSGKRVTGPVRVGDPLTLVIFMRSEFEGFDIVVSDCYAHNGGNKRIALIDHFGCPIDETLISHFEGERTQEGLYQTQVYAFMKTFRFTGSPALYLECDVRMCHGDCPKQPCHWRHGKQRQRRSLGENYTSTETGTQDPSETPARPSNVSESLSLFQSLQVVRDDQMLKSALRDAHAGKVCLEGGTVSAMASVVAVIVGLLTAACAVLCLRLRRTRKQQQQQQPPNLNNNFSTTMATTTTIPRYRGDFVPPTMRRLE